MKIGFIGTGNMGSGMAANLLKAGHALTVHDLRKAATDGLVRAGATWAESPMEVARQSDIVLTSLPGPPEVKEVALGAKGILAGAKRGNFFIDMSTNSPGTVQLIAAVAREKGVAVFDAPVTGGVTGAAAGTLTIMVGGDENLFGTVAPLLDVMGKKVVHVGDVGAGNSVKLIHQMLGAVTNQVIAEAFVLGAKAGLDLKKLFEVLANSMSASPILTEKYPRAALKRNFDPGFAIDLAYKDQVLLFEMAKELGVPLSFASLVLQKFMEARARGLGARDTTAVILPLEEMLGVTVKL
ncbi:MAG: NAD(P)-dependent oxidoreductase [Chloroflexi bacterium]|nr:NAD(P)-dependent oxidoreductase [Chloroflexota bacterium]